MSFAFKAVSLGSGACRLAGTGIERVELAGMLFPRQPFTDKYGRAYPYRPDKRRVFGSNQTQARCEERAVRVVRAKHILSAGNGMNIYRGCTHGCIYCDSRSACYGIGHDFEDIEVKGNAIELLESALRRKRTKCMLGTGSMTDPYIPLESRTGYVRKALALAVRYGFGFTLMTKSDRVLRDLDLLQAINRKTKCVVQMTLTTCDEDLCRKIEPNVSTTQERAAVLRTLRDAGIPTVVWLFPHMKEKYIRTYGTQYQLNSPNNDMLMKLFHQICEDNGIVHDNAQIFEYLHKFEEKNKAVQLSLFDIIS